MNLCGPHKWNWCLVWWLSSNEYMGYTYIVYKKTHRGHAWNTTHNKPCVWIVVYVKVSASARPILRDDGTLRWQDQA